MSRVMIVDDSAFVRAFVNATLTKAGYKVYTAEDWAGVRAVLHGGEPMDLVLLDVNLPGLQSGDNLALSLARHPTTANAKLVLFSGKTPEELRELSKPPEIFGFIVKGRDPNLFLRAIFAIIGPPKPLD